jgi:hypothetical protein
MARLSRFLEPMYMRDSMNLSLGDIQGIIVNMRSDLNTLNLTYFQNSIEYLNQTLSDKINGLSAHLSGLNDSVLNELRDLESIILGELIGLNKTLQTQLADLRAITENFYNSIHDDLSALYLSLSLVEANLSAQHTTITHAITTLNDTIANAPELSTEEIINRINESIARIQSLDNNMTIHDSDIKAVLNTLSVLIEIEHDLTRTELLENLTVIFCELQNLDANITSHDQDVEDSLMTVSDLIENLGALDVSELSNKLTDLTMNVSEHNANIGEEIAAIDQSITDFQNDINEKLIEINRSLFDLAKLDDIINDLTELDQSFKSMENESKNGDEEQDFNFIVLMVFLALMMILLIVGAIFLIRENKMLKDTLNGGPKDLLLVDGDN